MYRFPTRHAAATKEASDATESNGSPHGGGGSNEWKLVGPGIFEAKSDNTFYFCEEDPGAPVKLSGQQQTYRGAKGNSSSGQPYS